MKRLYAVFFLLLVIMGLYGCGTIAQGSADADKSAENISIVATIFPEYDWVKEVLGDKSDVVELTLLINNGVDLHSYQPSVADVAKISDCDLFIYVGGESDEWVKDAISESVNKNMKAINLMEILGDRIKEEELVEGMEPDEDESDEEEAAPEFDEHVWLSLKNTKAIVEAISDAMSELDENNAPAYMANSTAYIQKLELLDNEYQKAVSSGSKDTLLFGDRFPFRYMVDDYGLSYYAPFAGCSAETEASFETIVFLANKVDELGLTTILTIEGSDQKIAETIAQNTNKKDQTIAVMNSMQGVTAADIENGANYLSIMENNLETLKLALE